MHLRTKYLSLVVTGLFAAACTHPQMPDVNVLYTIETENGHSGIAFFKAQLGEDLVGIFYQDEGRLFATPFLVSVRKDRKRAIMLFPDDTMTGFSFAPYQKPIPDYEELPEAGSYTKPIYPVEVQRDCTYTRAPGYYTRYPCAHTDPFWLIYTRKVIWERAASDLAMLDLDLDIYQPVGDPAGETRPLLMMIHGGAFFNGDKRQREFEDWCRHFASLGYVAVSIDYRIGFIADVNRAGYRAVQDARAALHYLLGRDDLRIDPDRVFVAGTSAGAITALNVAFMKNEDKPAGVEDEGNLDAIWAGKSDAPLDSTLRIRAVGNMWGAVHDPAMIKNSSNETDIISIHNSRDDIVPYAKGYPFQTLFGDLPVNEWILDEMFGSQYITGLAYEKGLRTELITYDLPDRQNPNSEKHSIHYDTSGVLNDRFQEIQDRLTAFFAESMERVPVKLHQNEQVFALTGPLDLGREWWDVEGGVVLKKEGMRRIRVLLFPDSAKCSVTVNGTYASGRTFKKTMLKLDRHGFRQEPEAVDLGLSVKWAVCDIGASSPVELGDKYSREELQSPDFFSTHFGKGWRLPTQKELMELAGIAMNSKAGIEEVDTPSGPCVRVTGKNGMQMLLPDSFDHWFTPDNPSDRSTVYSVSGGSGPVSDKLPSGTVSQTKVLGGLSRFEPVYDYYPVRAVRDY